MTRFFQEVWSRLTAAVDATTLAASVTDLLGSAAAAALTFALYYLVWRGVKLVLRPVLKRLEADEMTASFMQSGIKYVVLTLGAVSALSELGINTASILASLGVAGLTIGFAARDALSNIISGVFIFWDRPFVIGDLVEVEDHYGRVQRITLRSTRVITTDGRMLAIPNSTMVNQTVASYTNFPHLRLDVPVTIGPEEDLARVRQLAIAVVEGDDEYMSDPAPEMVVTALNDYNVEVEFQVWVDDEREHTRKRPELREQLFEALRAAGVDMPLETLEIAPIEIRKAS